MKKIKIRSRNPVAQRNEAICGQIMENLNRLARIEAVTGWRVDFTSPTGWAAPLDNEQALEREIVRLRGMGVLPAAGFPA